MKKFIMVAALAAFAAACGAPAANNTAANKPANAAANTAAPANTATPAANTAANAATAPAPAGGAQDFNLVNKTGVIISSLYITPSDSEEWGEDILGKDVLGDGENTEIKFKRSEKAAKWDLKIEDSKGNTIEWTDLNLLEINKVTLKYDGKKGTAETE